MCTQKGIPRMAKVRRRSYPQVPSCQDCGNRTPRAIKHRIALHLTLSGSHVSSIPLSLLHCGIRTEPDRQETRNTVGSKQLTVAFAGPLHDPSLPILRPAKAQKSPTWFSRSQIAIFETSLTSGGGFMTRLSLGIRRSMFHKQC